MNLFLTLAFLFFIGSVVGWIMELLFRHFIASGNPEHKWINPGFCTGPYLPLYGFGLCILYAVAQLEAHLGIDNPVLSKTAVFLMMAVCMTGIEYVAGILCLRILNMRLWDYTDEWGNVQGIICPKFSLIWAFLGAMYYFLIHPHILNALNWLSGNLAFSFVIGFFFGILVIDAAMSVHLVTKLKQFAEKNNVIVRYEAIKADIRKKHDEAKKRYNFFRPFKTDIPLLEHLEQLKDSFEKRKSGKH